MEGYEENKYGLRELTIEEIKFIAEAGKRLGIKAYKITGGEPTLREDLVDIVGILKSYNSYVSITTNASLLHRHLDRLVEVGIDHINVSLHAISPHVFKIVTGTDLHKRTIENLYLARDYGVKLKINFVVLKEMNEEDISRVIELASKLDASVQFIELHPVGRAVKIYKKHRLPRWKVLEILEDRVVEIKYRIGLHNRPVLLLDNGVRVELVGPVGNFLFCAGCTRIRITYDFKLVPCLNWRGPVIEVRPSLEAAESFEEKVEVVVRAIREANSMREPFVKYPAKPVSILRPKRDEDFRIGIPKRDGRIDVSPSAKKYMKKRDVGYTELV